VSEPAFLLVHVCCPSELRWASSAGQPCGGGGCRRRLSLLHAPPAPPQLVVGSGGCACTCACARLPAGVWGGRGQRPGGGKGGSVQGSGGSCFNGPASATSARASRAIQLMRCGDLCSPTAQHSDHTPFDAGSVTARHDCAAGRSTCYNAGLAVKQHAVGGRSAGAAPGARQGRGSTIAIAATMRRRRQSAGCPRRPRLRAVGG
jgi:hypothetical protein